MTRPKPNKLWCGLLLALFVVAGTVRYWNTRGDDLGSSFLGCRVLGAGAAGALYSYDPEKFSDIDPHDTIWHQQAKEAGYTRYLHPYVQTPLWAWALLPLCEHTSFSVFSRLFVVLTLASMAGMIAVVAWAWAPFFLRPIPMALLLTGFWFSQPFAYAMFLTQTHALYMVLVLAGLVLAERDREWTGGLLVALAAAVKLTPAALFLYWLATRRWRAAASLALCSVALMALTWAVFGTPLLRAYLVNLHRLSEVLLLSENNQSFATWLMGHFYSREEIFHFAPLHLPTAVRLGSDLLLLAGTIAGGLLDRHPTRGLIATAIDPTPRLGVAVALLSATIFAPIAWTHYFILLVIPVMLLVEEARRLPARWAVPIGLLTVAAVALNFRPFAADLVRTFTLGRFAVLRGQFFSGLLCLAALCVAWWAERSSHIEAAELHNVATTPERGFSPESIAHSSP